MHKVAMFVEDQAHYEFLKALLQRLGNNNGTPLDLQWRNARHGHGKVIRELQQYIRDLGRDRQALPDLVVVAIDANCKGLNKRTKEVREITDRIGIHVICAIPDPHIERWLLLDSSAFKTVFGRGCTAPDRKCERGRYKKQLCDNIVEAGIFPNLGGIEYADEIVQAMDLERAAQADHSLARLLSDLRSVFHKWRRSAGDPPTPVAE